MPGSRNAYAYGPQRLINDRQPFFSNFVVSGICHLLFFSIFIFAPRYTTHKKPTLSFINVSMVTLPAPETTPASKDQQVKAPVTPSKPQKKTPAAKISTKTPPETVSKTSTAIPLRTKKKKTKQSLKKKTFKSSKVVKSAITRIEKNIDKSKPDQITQAINRLKDKVGKTRPKDTATPTQVKTSGIVGGAGSGPQKVLQLMQIYQHEIGFLIRKNWAFSEQLAGGRTNLEAWVVIKVLPNGEIKDVWFDKRSGNRYFDESVEKAILKSNPLPPFPKAYTRPFFEPGFHFTPEDLKQIR